jgi:hypothetical protein
MADRGLRDGIFPILFLAYSSAMPGWDTSMSLRCALVAAFLVATGASTAFAGEQTPSACPQVIRRGAYELCAPAPLDSFGRGFKGCRRGRRAHPAVDINGVGKDRGLGTPVRSMTRARVVMVGRPEDNPGEFGRPDDRPGTAVRGGFELPRCKDVPGYGRVHFFSRTMGSWRSGGTVVLEGLGGGLKGHRIRYMHLGGIHPSIQPGVVVEAGQEIGLMGATAIQRTVPHVHIDVVTPNGRPLDIKALLAGDKPRSGACRAPKGTAKKDAARKGSKGTSAGVRRKGSAAPRLDAPTPRE